MKPTYKQNFVDPKDYEELISIDWVQRETTPRKEYWDTTLNLPYTYGRGRGLRTYEPNPPLEIVQRYRELLTHELGVYFEGCFLNRYDTSRDWLGWHADDDLGIDHSKPIAVVTLGQARNIQWKLQGSKGLEAIDSQLLEEGSLFVMPPGMQQTHFHRIPKASFEVVRPRISLTFRALKIN